MPALPAFWELGTQRQLLGLCNFLDDAPRLSHLMTPSENPPLPNRGDLDLVLGSAMASDLVKLREQSPNLEGWALPLEDLGALQGAYDKGARARLLCCSPLGSCSPLLSA